MMMRKRLLISIKDCDRIEIENFALLTCYFYPLDNPAWSFSLISNIQMLIRYRLSFFYVSMKYAADDNNDVNW